MKVHRTLITTYKRTLKAAQSDPTLVPAAQVAALALLERSIQFGHKKLALKRLGAALSIGALPSEEHMRYCHKLASQTHLHDGR